MKSIIKLVVLFSSLIFSVQLCWANGVIARVSDTSSISTLVMDFTQILGVEQAGSTPFVRFEVADEDGESLLAGLLEDSRIVWAEAEGRFSGENQMFSSHGSSVAAIFDQTSTYSQNTSLWQQINYAMPNLNFQCLRIGIVDTGVSHLQTGILSRVVAGASFVPSSSTIDDYPTGCDTNMNGTFDEGAGHGTMIAGIILQMLPSAPFVIAKSADSDGIGTSWSVIEGIVFCMENGTRIINVSLGSSQELPGMTGFLKWVEEQGVTVISPIGNTSANMTFYPGGYSSVVNIAGLQSDNTKASFSNWDQSALVAVPATGISGAWWDGTTVVRSGTSLGAPLVTACLVAGLTLHPTKTPGELRQALADSGTNIDGFNLAYAGKLGKLLNYSGFLSNLNQ